jgi:hypothetical protein
MTDLCEKCNLKGNIHGCQQGHCSIRDSWYSTQLREENKKLRISLKKCALVLAGAEMTKSALIQALESARELLKDEEIEDKRKDG